IRIKIPARRTALRLALAAASVSAVAALFSSSPQSPAPSPQGTPADVDLAALYSACPMSAVINLKTVASNPQRVDALLPPFRPTVHREPDPPTEPAIPRIRYPVAVRPGGDKLLEASDGVRIAQN